MRISIIALFASLTASLAVAQVSVGSLHNRISKVCPIHGVAVPDPADKSGWVIQVAPEATAEQRSNAASIIATWTAADWDPPSDKRARKYASRVDQWTHAIVRYQTRLLDARLSAEQKAKIQTKLDAAVLKVQDESTAIEMEDPD